MHDMIGAFGGFRGVRADLLVALKKAQPMTAHELGERFGLTANALRRHLKALEADGLVRFVREIRGVGAPVYTFSPAGDRSRCTGLGLVFDQDQFERCLQD